MSKKKEKKILADKIADLIAPRKLLDPEVDEEDETAAKTFEYDYEEDDVTEKLASGQFSDIRKRNEKLLQDVDKKYSGKISSRKDLESESENEDDEESAEDDDDDEVDEEAIKSFSMKLGNGEANDDESEGENDERIEDDENDDADEEESETEVGNQSGFNDYEDGEGDNDDEEDEDEGVDEDDEDNVDDEENSDESDFDGGDIVATKQSEDTTKSILPKKQKDDQLKKGLCIQNQLQIWEKLLEMRIHSQKILIQANSLPNYEKFHRIVERSEKFQAVADESQKNVSNLLDKMQELQTTLLKRNSEAKTEVLEKRKRSARPASESIEAKCQRLENDLSGDFNSFTEYRNSVISKWYDRTKVLTPGSVKTQKLHGNIDVLRKIEGVLANRVALVKKSQLVKGGYKLFDAPEEEKTIEQNQAENEDAEQANDELYCSEVYDDTDFYHTQLRELIEFKASTSISPNDMAKQFVELQKLRKKMKKTVDTRASKGRKIRYVVHNKLVSFMAPNDASEWTDESKTELYKSLFGQQS